MALLDHILTPELLLDLTHRLLSIRLLLVLACADEPSSCKHPGLRILTHCVLNSRLIVFLLRALHRIVPHALFEASLRLDLVGLRLEVRLDLVVVADEELVVARRRDVLPRRVRRVGPVLVTQVDCRAVAGGLLRGHAPFGLHLHREFEVMALRLVLADARRDVLIVVIFPLAAACLSTAVSV